MIRNVVIAIALKYTWQTRFVKNSKVPDTDAEFKIFNKSVKCDKVKSKRAPMVGVKEIKNR